MTTHYQILAILDQYTCPVCTSRDLTWTSGPLLMPPFHGCQNPNGCRCLAAPITPHPPPHPSDETTPTTDA